MAMRAGEIETREVSMSDEQRGFSAGCIALSDAWSGEGYRQCSA
jgi:hypothetical protein